MKNRFLIVSALLIITLTGCRKLPPGPISTVSIGGHTVKVIEASDPDAQARGLAGVVRLNDDEGMLFRFKDKADRSFWMKGMRIPIDIVWIADDTIVGIERTVQPPKGAVPDSELERYASPLPVNYVLELAAGYTDRYPVQIGDTVYYR